jgi:hypothetical protein
VLLASMFKSQEHSLLKPGFGHNVWHALIPFQKLVTLNETKPEDICPSRRTLSLTLHNCVQKVVLGLSLLNEVSPSTQIMTHTEVSFSVDNSLKLLCCLYSTSKHLSLSHEGLSPQIEKLLRPLETDVPVNQLIPFLGLMDTIKGISVPESDGSPFRILHKLCDHSSGFCEASF